MEEGISVIVCCFNSSLRLQPTLEHLCLQKKIPVSKWEVIVVDNASSDSTSEKAMEIWNSFTSVKPSFKVVHEPNPGLSSARKKGIQEALFKYVLFCDDDNWLDQNYLDTALNIMNSSPQIGALGGIGDPVFEKEEPPYFWQNQYHVLAVGSQGKKEGDITEERGVLYGAGMVLNKAAFNILRDKFDFKFQVSDRIGNNLISSGDHELCLALKQIGYRIYYSKSLVFKHYIPAKRTSLKYYKELFLSFGMSDAMLSVYFIHRNNINSIKNDYRYICLRCTKNIIKTCLILTFKGYYFSLNKYKYVSHLHHLYNNLGMLKKMIAKKNSFKKVIQENPLFNSAHAKN
ncbi:MAG: glycosyltransferase [Segetibacter sp.]